MDAISLHVTTRDAITATVLIMLENPGVRERILADPARVIPKLTEEALRRDAPHRGLFRITTREVELGGAVLPAGAPLLLLFGSGNRDETVFAHPDLVDLDRPNVRDHLAFGRGLHSCPRRPDGPGRDQGRAGDADQAAARAAADRRVPAGLHRELLLPRSGIPRGELVTLEAADHPERNA